MSFVSLFCNIVLFIELFPASATGCLATKTRVLVTHGLTYLKHCDQVIVVKDGTISEMGTYKELMNNNGAFSEFLEEFLLEESKHRGRSISFGEDCEFNHKFFLNFRFSAKEVDEILKDLDQVSPAIRQRIESQMSQEIAREDVDQVKNGFLSNEGVQSAAHSPISKNEEKEALLGPKTKEKESVEPPKQAKTQLIEKETVETGKVKFEVYMSYFRAIGLPIAILFFLVYVASSVLGVFSNLYLAQWSDDAKKIAESGNSSSTETQIRLGIYAMLGMGQGF